MSCVPQGYIAMPSMVFWTTVVVLIVVCLSDIAYAAWEARRGIVLKRRKGDWE